MNNAAKPQILYSERVTPSWFAFLPLLAIFPTFWLAFAPINLIAGLASGLAVTALVAFLMVRLSPRITVQQGRLTVSGASVETEFIGQVQVIPKAETFAEKGPKLNANAYLALQSSRKGLLKIYLTDSRDITPYWLVSSRNPGKLATWIDKARA
jgi:hypothetical protein